MINLKISHNLQKKIDEVHSVNFKIKEAMEIGSILSTDEIEDELYNILGDKARWYEVKVNDFNNTISIGPTAETEADSEKMRYIEWAYENHGQQMQQFARETVKKRIVNYYRGLPV